jgi:hypothetical protein
VDRVGDSCGPAVVSIESVARGRFSVDRFFAFEARAISIASCSSLLPEDDAMTSFPASFHSRGEDPMADV